MFRPIVLSLFLAVFGICGIIGSIGCGNLEVLLIDLTDPDPIEPGDNEWIGTWTLESYQGLSLLETLAEYDDYDEEDWTFLAADGSVVGGALLEQAIAAFWSGDGVTGYDGSITYTFSGDRSHGDRDCDSVDAAGGGYTGYTHRQGSDTGDILSDRFQLRNRNRG